MEQYIENTGIFDGFSVKTAGKSGTAQESRSTGPRPVYRLCAWGGSGSLGGGTDHQRLYLRQCGILRTSDPGMYFPGICGLRKVLNKTFRGKSLLCSGGSEKTDKLLHIIGQIFILMVCKGNGAGYIKILDPDLGKSAGTQFFNCHDLRENGNAQIALAACRRASREVLSQAVFTW